MQVEQGHSYLLCHSHNLCIVKHEFALVKKIKKTSFVDKLCDHVEVRLLVETHAHVKHHIGVSQLVKHFDLLNKIFQGLFRQVALSKSLDSDLCAHPLSLVHISISSPAYEI